LAVAALPSVAGEEIDGFERAVGGAGEVIT
jgi:hypothetical protein